MCQKIEKVQPERRAIIRHQMDGAGPHKCDKLQAFLKEEFAKRGWILVPQPSNSPIADTNDDCTFPALGKHVSREQGITKGSLVFTPDELWSTVERCWRNFPLDALARACVRHSQVASAMACCNGGDDFVRARGGLHMNARKCCATVCNSAGEPLGVEVSEACDNDDETADAPSLAHQKPFINTETLDEQLLRMTEAELQLMWAQSDQSHPYYQALNGAMTLQDIDVPNLSLFDPPMPSAQANKSADFDTQAVQSVSC